MGNPNNWSKDSREMPSQEPFSVKIHDFSTIGHTTEKGYEVAGPKTGPSKTLIATSDSGISANDMKRRVKDQAYSTEVILLLVHCLILWVD